MTILMNTHTSLRRSMAMALGCLLLMSSPAMSQDAAKKGFEVAAKSDRSDRGFGDSTVILSMVLKNAAGAESTRSMAMMTLELPDESIGDRSLVRFDSPADIEGTSLLSHAQIIDADDQWLFLPALKRVKRISSRNKSGPFVGSEFAFEDITGNELKKYEYVWIREESCGDVNCDVLERKPRYENSGYTRQLVWIDQPDAQYRKIEYYDRKDDLLKTQTFEDYKLYDGKFWRAQVFRMDNHQTGKSTILNFGEYTFNTGLTDSDFEKGVLRRQF